MSNIETIKQLIDLWPARKALAEDVSTTKGRVDKWAQSGAIPAKFHARVLRAAKCRDIPVTADDLIRLHDSPREEAA